MGVDFAQQHQPTNINISAYICVSVHLYLDRRLRTGDHFCEQKLSAFQTSQSISFKASESDRSSREAILFVLKQ